MPQTRMPTPTPTYHHCKKPGQRRNQCSLLKRQREQAEGTETNSGNKNSGANNSIPNNNNQINNNKINNT